MTASGFVHIGPGYLSGIFVSSCSKVQGQGPTITFYDKGETDGTLGEPLVGIFKPVDPFYYLIPAVFNKGLWLEITGQVDAHLTYT